MTRLLTREEMDSLHCSCGEDGCTQEHGPLWLRSQCHTDMPTWARYEEGVVTLICFVCHSEVANIEVASLRD